MILIRALSLGLLAFLAATPSHARASAGDIFQTITLPAGVTKASGTLPIKAFGRVFNLQLEPNGDLLRALAPGQRQKIGETDQFLRGRMIGYPNSWVRLNRISGRYSGGFYDGSELYLIDRASALPAALDAGVAAGQAIIFRFADLDYGGLIDRGALRPGKGAGGITSSVGYETFVDHLKAITIAQGSAMLALPVTIVSDEQFSNTHGASTASVVAGRVNFVDGIYASQLGVGIQLFHHEILRDNDVLVATNASNLLDGEFDGNTLVQPGFRQFMVSGAGSNIPFAGLAHLFTGRNLDGSTVGVAYLGVLCSGSFGYGVNQNRRSDTGSALVFAHELGHNFGSPHDGEEACADESFRGIMNPSLNGSEQFSDCSINEMSQRVARASCLVDRLAAQRIFSSSFE